MSLLHGGLIQTSAHRHDSALGIAASGHPLEPALQKPS
jgi:hypothetical protein